MSVVVTEPVTDGLVLMKLTVGDVLIELWPREAPKACRNFVQLCLEGYYDGLPFHRIVPGFIAQTGDRSGTGHGGESIFDDGEFEDEFSQRLKFNRRGLLGMANQGRKNSNLSQFFFTLDSTMELQNKNTMFGRVLAGDTLFNVLKLGQVEIEPGTDRPVFPPKIKSVQVKSNPFSDMVPRITAKERKEQEKAKMEMKLERAKQRELGKRKGTKNKALLSFGEEAEEAPVDPALAQTKFKSAHDVENSSGRLSKQILDDRGTSATLPDWINPQSDNKRKTESSVPAAEKRMKMSPPPNPSSSTPSLQLAREAKAKSEINANDKVRAEIAKVEADLKRMTRNAAGESDSEGEVKKKKKPKRVGPSLLELEREKYSKSSKISKGKAKKSDETDLDSLLAGFRSKLAEAPSGDVSKPEKKAHDDLYGIREDDSSGDEGWASHRLVFAKDATLDQHTADEYAVHDPLSRESASLAELKEKSDKNKQRKYAGKRGERHTRDSGRNSARNDRREDQRERGRSDQFSRDRPEVRGGNWKQDRVSTTDLA